MQEPATNPFCFNRVVCSGRGNDSCSTTDREGAKPGTGGEGGEERVKYLAYLTCRPRCSSATVEKEPPSLVECWVKRPDKPRAGIWKNKC